MARPARFWLHIPTLALLIGWGFAPRAAGQAGDPWFWQNPLPQGNALHAVSFGRPSIGTAVGRNGSIVRTEDGGATWHVQFSGTRQHLHGVSVSSNDHATAVGEGGTILRTVDGGENWAEQVSGTQARLDAVVFGDPSLGAAVGELGTILMTADGGATWLPQSTGSERDLHAVCFIAPYSWVAAGEAGTVLRSTGIGGEWIPIPAHSSIDLLGIQFSDSDHGIAVGTDSLIYTTTNGGESWRANKYPRLPASGKRSHIDYPDSYVVRAVSMRDPYNGSAVGYRRDGLTGGATGFVLYTVNSGYNWQILSLAGTRSFPHGVSAKRPDTTHWVGGHGDLWQTTERMGTPSDAATHSVTWRQISDVSFVDPLTGTAVGYGGTVLRTEDGGTTWLDQGPANDPMTAVSMFDAQVGMAVSLGGVILSTTDGATWSETRESRFSYLMDIAVLSPSTAFAVGVSDRIFRTQDGGGFWELHVSGTDSHFQGLSFADANLGLVVGSGGTILRSDDGGDSWIPQQSPTSVQLNAVCFPNPNVGTAVGEAGTILRSDDGGVSWHEQSSGTSADLTDVSFSGPNFGMAVGIGGIVLSTENGGASWILEHPGTDEDLWGVSVPARGIATIVGASGAILRTEREVDVGTPVLIGDFRARVVDERIELGWSISADESVRALRLFRRSDPGEEVLLSEEAFEAGEQRFVDETAERGVSYRYSLVVVLPDSRQIESEVVEIELPRVGMRLSQNHPNPFNPETTIEFDIPHRTRVEINVYSLSGALVRTLLDREMPAGSGQVTWMGRDARGNPVASGVYFCQLETDGRTLTRKMTLLK